MKSIGLLAIFACAGLLYGCAAHVPRELAGARVAYRHASLGPAPQLAPAELQGARTALDEAEEAFAKDATSFRTLGLATLAGWKARAADARACALEEQESANNDCQVLQDILHQEETPAPDRTSGPEPGPAMARLAAIWEEDRGVAGALSRGVRFGLGDAILTPEAESRLDQVLDARSSSTDDRNIIVEGFTDSRGSTRHNLDLSRRRADAVRDYLVRGGYDPGRIEARGAGEARPIADNANAAGRSHNRRVEVIWEREAGW